MNKLTVFCFSTLNGFYKGPNEDISWHNHDSGEDDFVTENLKTGNILLFGRITYQLMAGYWPTQEAIKTYPLVATGMNSAEKIVFSRTLDKATWNNTRLVPDRMTEEIQRLKKTGSKNMTLLGSGNVLTQLAEQGLVDEYQVMIDPVALGDGTPMFKNATRKLDFRLTGTRTFKSGAVLLTYVPANNPIL